MIACSRSPAKILSSGSSKERKKRELPGVALAARAAAQLVVDAARLVALGADDVQAAGGDHLLVQLLPVCAHAPRCAVPSRLGERLVGLDLLDLGIGIAAEHDVRAAARPCWWRW
jgi:hypothetical protein